MLVSNRPAGLECTRQEVLLVRPSPKELERLKAPLGQLLAGTPEEAIPKLRLLIEEAKPPMVITVGDVVSRETLKAGLKIDLRIVDNRSMRQAAPGVSLPAKNTYSAKNPPGTISMEAWQVVRRAVGEKDSLVVIDGEEDLLVLPVTLEAPDNSFVIYGQPREGMVVVTATAPKKREVATTMERMKRENWQG